MNFISERGRGALSRNPVPVPAYLSCILRDRESDKSKICLFLLLYVIFVSEREKNVRDRVQHSFPLRRLFQVYKKLHCSPCSRKVGQKYQILIVWQFLLLPTSPIYCHFLYSRGPTFSCSKIGSNQLGLSRFHATLVTKNWSLSDPNPKLIITDPDPANNSGSDRIHNT